MGYQIVEPSAGDTEWSNFSTLVNNAMQGFIALSLTNFDTTDVPSIAAGGQVEVAGSLYTFASTEAITGSLSTNQNYIMLTTSSSSITASYTSDDPTWVPSKSGWYDSSTGVQRYIGGSATDFSGKWVYDAYFAINGNLETNGVNSFATTTAGVLLITVTDSAPGSRESSGRLRLKKPISGYMVSTITSGSNNVFFRIKQNGADRNIISYSSETATTDYGQQLNPGEYSILLDKNTAGHTLTMSLFCTGVFGTKEITIPTIIEDI